MLIIAFSSVILSLELFVMQYAILCGAAPEAFRQKKLVAMHDFLTSSAGGNMPERAIVLFPNGVHELLLESELNAAFDEAAGTADDESTPRNDATGRSNNAASVLLYLCTLTQADARAALTSSACAGVEVLRLGSDEIRTDVIAYYAGLADKMGIGFRFVHEADAELVNEESIGYERIR